LLDLAGQRNYHIFYQLCANGCMDLEAANRFQYIFFFHFQNYTDVIFFKSPLYVYIPICSYKYLLEASVTDLNASAVDILEVDDRVNFVKTEDAVRNLLFTGPFHFYCYYCII
jgi:hypothetical protein